MHYMKNFYSNNFFTNVKPIVIKNCSSKLQTLSFIKCHDLIDPGYFEHFKNLEILILRKNNSVNDNFLEKIRFSCRKLRKVDITGNKLNIILAIILMLNYLFIIFSLN